jgi:methyl-accepting chemotaxis protein
MKISFLSKFSFRKNIRVKITVFFMVMVISIAAALAYILYLQSYKMITDRASEEAFRTVSQSSKYLDIEAFKTLISPEDEESDYYIQERKNLMKIREISGAKYIFTMRKTTEGKFMYVIDGSPSEELSHIGDTEESEPSYEQAWSGSPYTDNQLNVVEGWGIFISSYYPLTDSQGNIVGIIGADFDAESIYQELNRFKEISMMVLLIFTAIIFLSGLIFSGKLSRSIKRASDYSKKLAEFDLKSDISRKELRKKDEFGILANSLESIRDNFKHIIQKINASSKQVAVTSQQLTAASSQSAKTAEEVSSAIQEIAGKALEQTKNTTEGTSRILQLGNIIDNNLESANHISSSITNVTEAISSGFGEMESLYKITEESNSANKKIYDLIIKTNDSSQKISEASSLISSIALQTKLLALNAAIEASKAGQAGRGFSIVADEIKELAALSADSSKDIEEIVSELQKNAANAVDIMDRIKNITAEQTQRVESSRANYKFINGAMEESQKASHHLSDTGKEMYDMKNMILTLLEHLTDIAKQNSSAAGEVNRSMEEEADVLEEIAASSDILSGLAEDLHNMILEFKI